MEESGQMDYSKPIKIGDGIFWIGYADDNAGLHCNPYIIIDSRETASSVTRELSEMNAIIKLATLAETYCSP